MGCGRAELPLPGHRGARLWSESLSCLPGPRMVFSLSLSLSLSLNTCHVHTMHFSVLFGPALLTTV